MLAKSSATATFDSHMTVNTALAFATLGGTSKNKNYPICVVPPNVAKASKESNIAGFFSGIIALNFANVNIAEFNWQMENGSFACPISQCIFNHIFEVHKLAMASENTL
jgi:hypothetical protein